MKETSASSTLVVTDLEMAKVLSSLEHLRYIVPFLAQERTVGEVTAELDSHLSTTYRRVQRYCDLGILDVVREKPRKGKPLKVYRAAADAFFIPFQLTDEQSSAPWYEQWNQDFQRGFKHAFGNQLGDWGRRIHRKDGVFTIDLAKGPAEDLNPLEPDMPAYFNRSHDSLYLDFTEAKTLQGELDALFEKYMKHKGQQRYIMRLSFVPVPEDTEIMP